MITDVARIHGGPDGQGAPLHDFSTNSNACGPCPMAMDAVAQADASRYPDASYTVLRQQLASLHGVDASRVLLAASASEFIFRITALVAQRGGRRVHLPAHGYGDYAHAADAHRLQAVTGGAPADLYWRCDPSSPLGQSPAGPAELPGLNDGLCVLDLAYAPLRLNDASALRHPDGVWQLWTPNKALGMTGVRAAYVIAPAGSADTATALESLCPSWPVGAHGVAMLQAWVSPEVQAWLVSTLHTLRAWKSRQVGLLSSLGWDCLTSDTNFFVARPDLPPGMVLRDALTALRIQGIKLRDTTSFGLPGQVRVGVLAPEAQDALHNAWRQLMKVST